jgi:peptidyl-prolyl cis-trans isomerase SurA
MRRHLLLTIALATLAVASPRAALAQGLVRTDPGETIERVVAVAGDSVITLTELQEYILTLRAQGQLPNDPAQRAEIEEQALEALVDQMLILQEAAADSTLIPDEEEIEGRVAEIMEQSVQSTGGSAAFQAALAREGVTQGEYRDMMTQRVRREQIRQAFMATRVRDSAPVPITETEARQMFEATRTQIGERPEILTIRQAVVRPAASDSAWNAAKVEADAVLARVRAGEDFATLAQQNSDDGSGAAGGDLGWFRRGMMVREFEEMAFRLPAGQVSEPVRSEYGWHIIKVERTRPGEVNARHILFRPEEGQTADERARTQAEEIARRARAGESFAALLDEFRPNLLGEDEIPDSVALPRAQMSQALPPDYQQPLANVTKGQIVGPFPFVARAQTNWVVVEVTDIRPGGAYTFEELRPQIDARLSEERTIERILTGLRERYYVEIRL